MIYLILGLFMVVFSFHHFYLMVVKRKIIKRGCFVDVTIVDKYRESNVRGGGMSNVIVFEYEGKTFKKTVDYQLFSQSFKNKTVSLKYLKGYNRFLYKKEDPWKELYVVIIALLVGIIVIVFSFLS